MALRKSGVSRLRCSASSLPSIACIIEGRQESGKLNKSSGSLDDMLFIEGNEALSSRDCRLLAGEG